MAGTLTTLLVSGLLAQAPGGFTFEGREDSARTEQPDGFFIQGPLPFTDLSERGAGSASLQVEDRVSLPGATYGDVGTLSATFRLGAVVYRVELARPGFPPAQAQGRAPSGPLPQPPPHTIQGGVLLDVPLYGDSGLGWSAMTRTHAAAAAPRAPAPPTWPPRAGAVRRRRPARGTRWASPEAAATSSAAPRAA